MSGTEFLGALVCVMLGFVVVFAVGYGTDALWGLVTWGVIGFLSTWYWILKFARNLQKWDWQQLWWELPLGTLLGPISPLAMMPIG